MSADWNEIDARLIARAWEDKGFRAILLRDPAAAMAQTGLTLPEGVQLKVVEQGAGAAVEEAPGVHALVLPVAPGVDESDDFELSLEEIDTVAGGGPGGATSAAQPTCPGYASYCR
ncbi:MAG: NHLP leader peptide family RiPP precursor [Ardenticatenaceae bacterium]|nr:NHLP leader peptide family RiPP precursor [Ardenticatenaceae bacterium]